MTDTTVNSSRHAAAAIDSAGWRLLDAERYFVASLLALGVDLAVFSCLTRVFDWSWLYAATVAFSLGALVTYVASVKWVFKNRAFKRHPSVELLIFFAIGVAGLGLTQLFLWIFIEKIRLPGEASKLLAAGFTFLFNYSVRKMILFSPAFFKKA